MAGRLSKLIDDTEKKIKKDVGQSIDQLQEGTRGKVTTNIVSLYIFCIFCIIILSVAFSLTGNSEGIKSLNLPVDVVKTLVLPVVTFILGFYFAAKK